MDDSIDVVNRDGRISARTPGNHEAGLFAETGTPVQAVARTFTLTPHATTEAHGNVFAIGDYFFELNATDGSTVSNVGADPVKAVGVLSLTGVALATETIVIQGRTYTFRAIADYDANNEIGVPADGLAVTQAAYIASAVNGVDGYNTPNAHVTAKAEGATVWFTAKNVGAGGDAITTTETLTNGSFDGATLGAQVAGVNPQYFPVDITAYADKSQGTLTLATLPAEVNTDQMTVGATTYTFVAAATAAGYISIGGNLLDTANNIIAAINGTDGLNTANASVTAAGGGAGVVILTAIIGGTAGDSIVTTETFTAAGNVFDAATLGTTTAGADPTNLEVNDAVVATITALNTSGDVPFTATDGGATSTITSVLRGTTPNGYVIYETLDGSLVQAVAGVDGTPGIRGCFMQDGDYIYVLVTATEATETYLWERAAIASF